MADNILPLREWWRRRNDGEAHMLGEERKLSLEHFQPRGGKMLTLVQGYEPHAVRVASRDGDVRIRVKSKANGLPETALTKREVHDALLDAKERAEDFIAAVEGDIEATAA